MSKQDYSVRMLPLSEPASSLFTRLSCLFSKVSRFRHHIINLQTYLSCKRPPSTLIPNNVAAFTLDGTEDVSWKSTRISAGVKFYFSLFFFSPFFPFCHFFFSFQSCRLSFHFSPLFSIWLFFFFFVLLGTLPSSSLSRPFLYPHSLFFPTALKKPNGETSAFSKNFLTKKSYHTMLRGSSAALFDSGAPVAKLMMLPLSEPASSLFTRLSCLSSKVSRFRHHIINLQTYLSCKRPPSTLIPNNVAAFTLDGTEDVSW